MTLLNLAYNTITQVPAELAALTGLVGLGLEGNQLIGVPRDFRTVNPSSYCALYDNPNFSCTNVGAGTTCCISNNNCDDPPSEGLSGGPCTTG